MKRLLAIIFLFLSVCGFAQLDKAIPNRPSPPRLVNDFANILTEEQEMELERKLVAYDDSTSTQVTVVTVQSLQGYEDEEFALALGRKWGVGGKEFNNGIVILVATEDRKIRIEVGYGLEGAIPDITAQRIIDYSITPEFKEGHYYRGLDHAVDDIMKAAAGEYTAPPKKKKDGGKGFGIGAFILFIIVMSILGGLGGGRGGRGGGMVSRRGYGDVAAGWILGSLLGGGSRGGGWSGGGGGGWSGGGGGGFGGFGGGSFGGGGASGSW